MQQLPLRPAVGGARTPRIRPAAFAAALIAGGLWAPGLAAAPKADWIPVTAEELSADTPEVEPDAPAEVLLRRVDIDDRDYPRERTTREYIRIKVYRPEHLDAVTRAVALEFSGGSFQGHERTVKMAARLTLPDRHEKVFGDESVRERPLVQSGAERGLLARLLGGSATEVRERFLAISGVEAGAVLEYRIDTTDRLGGFLQGFDLQMPRIGIRRLEYHIRHADPAEWICRYYVLNGSVGHVALVGDKPKRQLTITATDLPARPVEPMAPPTGAYYSLYFLFNYEPRHVRFFSRRRSPGNDEFLRVDPRKAGPWAPVAAMNYLLVADRLQLTSRIRQRTAEVAAGATDSLDQARRIYHHVQELYARYRDEAKQNRTRLTNETASRTLDDLLNYDRKSNVAGISDRDFAALLIAMYQAAGLEAKAILLPDLQRLPFGANLVAAATLPVLAVGVQAGGEWHFLLPSARPALPFGTLPWVCEGKAGLWVQAGDQQFERIPAEEPEKSLIGNAGTFAVAPDGALTGEGQRRFTGHAAETLRGQLIRRDPRGQRAFLARTLNALFRLPGAATAEQEAETTAESSETPGENAEEPAGGPVTIDKISGVDDPEAAIEVSYRLHLPGYAVITGDRIIFRGNPFRLNSDTPFTASTRKLDVWFPYPWEELDVAALKLPDGYRPDFTGITPPAADRSLHYSSQLRYNPPRQQLELRREFACRVVTFPAANYAGLKAWYDEMAHDDRQEVVLTKVLAAAPPPAAP